MTDFEAMIAAAAGATSPVVAPVQAPIPESAFMDASGLDIPTPVVPPIPDVPTQRKMEVAGAAEDKRVELGGPPSEQVFRNAALARLTGSGKASASGIEADLINLSYDELEAKYGDRTPGLVIGLAAAEGQISAQRSNSRGGGDALADTATGVGLGLANSILGIGALGAGVVSSDAGVFMADKIAKLNDYVRGTQSPALQSRQASNQEQTQLDRRDTKAQYEEDVKTDGETLAWMKRVGRDGINAVGNVLEDPAQLADGVSQGVGSVLAAGPVTKVLSKVGQAALGVKLSKTAGTSLAIGAMESGGTFVDTANSLADLTHAQLMERSENYKELIDKGWKPDEAKTYIINKTALFGAAATAPLAVAAGRLVARFEADPFKVPSLRTAAGNLVREGVEEGVQGGTSQISQNVAVQQIADNTRELAEGVGEQVGLGALYGVGTAGALQGPGVAKRTAFSTVGATGAALIGAARDRVAGLKAKNEAASPVSAEILAKASDEAVQAAPEAGAAVKEAVQQVEGTPEEKTAATAAVDRIMAAVGIAPEETAALPPSVQAMAKGVTNRFGLVQRMIGELSKTENPNAPPEDSTNPERRIEMASALLSVLQPLDEATLIDEKLFDAIPKDSVANKVLTGYQKLLANISTNGNLASAIVAAQQSLISAQAKGDIKDPVAATQAALLDPVNAKPVKVDLLLEQARQGKLKINERQLAALVAVQSILTANQATKDAQKDLGHKKPITDIKDQILTGTNTSYTYGTKTDKDRLSARGHVTSIFRAMQANSPERAKDKLEYFSNFVQHMQNKLDAVTRSLQNNGTGKGLFFTAWNPDAEEWYETKAQTIHLGNTNSVELGQRIFLEAQQLTAMYNGMVNAFPELGGKRFPEPVMPDTLKGTPQEIAVRTKENKAPTTTNTNNTSPTPEGGKQPNSSSGSTTKENASTTTTEETAPVVIQPLETTAVVTQETPVGDTQTTTTTTQETSEEKPAAPFRESSPASQAATEEVGAAVTEEIVAPKTIKEAFSNLLGVGLGSKVKNYFIQAFRLPSRMKSRLQGSVSPLTDLLGSLQNSVTMTDFSEGVYGENVPLESRMALADYLSKSADPLLKALNERLQMHLTRKRSGKSLVERMSEGDDITSWIDAKQLNIVEETGENDNRSYAYNQSLIEAATLAALQWYLSMAETENRIDESTAATIAKVSVDEVTEEMMDALSQGATMVMAVQGIAAKIRQYWGYDTDRNTGKGFTDGIPEAIAKELMIVLVDQGDLGVTKYQFDDGREVNIFNPVYKWPVDHPIHQVVNGLDKMILVKPQDVRHFDPEGIEVPDTQLRNSLVENSEEAKIAIKTANNVQYFPNQPIINFFQALGEAGYVELFGEGNLTKRVLNKVHKLSLEGKNRTIKAGYTYLMGLYAEAKSLAVSQGKEANEQAIHYAHNMHRAGRLQQLGGITPQNNKEVREAIISTWSELDLSDANGKHYELFMLSMAQSLGISIHKMTRQEALNQVTSWLEGDKLKPAIALMQKFSLANKIMPKEIIQLKELLAGIGLKRANTRARAINALSEYARYKDSSPEELVSFTTPAYIEADGVTNGPINAMMLMSAGEFTSEWQQQMQKGGVFFNTFKTINEYFKSSGAQDLYQTATIKLVKFLADKIQKYNRNPISRDKMTAMKDFLDIFLDGFEIQGNTLTIKRGVAKNPLTITIYGSSASGIAGKIRDTALEAMYEQFSLAAERVKANPSISDAEAMFGGIPGVDADKQYVRFTQAFMSLTNNTLTYNKQDGWHTTGKTPPPLGSDPFEDFTVHPIRMTNMKNNLRMLFVGPMVQAITETVGEQLTYTRKLVQVSGQIQSIFQQAYFRDLYEDLVAKKLAKDPKYVKSMGLSENELTSLHKKVVARFPMISSNEQTFYPAGSNSTEMNVEYARDMGGDIVTPGFVPGPRNAGVATTAYLTIGSGDGLSIQKFLSAADAPTDALTIFDGIHLKLSSLENDSVKANRSVYESWRSNPVGNLAKAFTSSLPGMDLSMLTEAEREIVNKGLESFELTELSDLEAALREAGRIIEARLKVLSKTSHVVDQLAGAEAPYVSQGVELTGDDVTPQLNLMLKEELKVPEEASTETPTETSSGVVSYTSENLSKLLDSLPLNPVQRAVYEEITVAKAAEGYTVLVGTAEELMAYARDRGYTIPNLLVKDRYVKGVTSTGSKTIYLVNDGGQITPEVIVHELIHAGSVETVVGVKYGSITDQKVVGAVNRLEAQMEAFLNLDPARMTSDQARAYGEAVAAISRYRDELGVTTPENQALAINEFMAWTLANQSLAEMQAGNIKERSLVESVRSALKAVRDFLLGSSVIPPNFRNVLKEILFDTTVVLQTQPTVGDQTRDLMPYMSVPYGNDERIQKILRTFQAKINEYLEKGPPTLSNMTQEEADFLRKNPSLTAKTRRYDYALALAKADELATIATNQGFDFTPQGRMAFRSIVAALSIESSIDPTSLSQAQALYTHVTKTATEEDYMVDPQANDPRDRARAEARYEFIIGRNKILFDTNDRSSLMPVFLALSLVDDQMREMLSKITPPKTVKTDKKGVDGLLENIANSTVDKLSDRLANVNKSSDVTQAMDALADRIQDLAFEQRSIIDRLTSPGGTFLDQVNQATVKGLQTLAEAAVDKTEAMAKNNPNSKLRKGATVATRIVASIVSEKRGTQVANGVMAAMNNVDGWDFIRTLASDIIGRTALNKNVYDLIKEVRADVQQDRQHYREILPTHIVNRFKRKLSDSEWTTLFKGLGKTDLASLIVGSSTTAALNLLKDPQSVPVRIQALEARLQAADPAHWAKVQAKAKQLANFMNTGIAGDSLLKNAYAVSRLFLQKVDKNRPAVTEAYTRDLDRLITLYSLDSLPEADKKVMQELVETEKDGMDFVLSYLQGQRKDELSRAKWGRAQVNHYKGYIPSVQDENVHLFVADDSQISRLMMKSYTRVGDYKGSDSEVGMSSKGYYFGEVPARMPFSQGIIQNVQQSVSGVDPQNGWSKGPIAGRIIDPRDIAVILRRKGRDPKGHTESLIPVLDVLGNVVAYERSLDPAQLSKLNSDTHLARMIGVWRGRQVEEAKAQIFNTRLMSYAKEMYDEDIKRTPSNKSQYVSLEEAGSQLDDPVLRDALSLLTKETWDMGRSIFEGPIMVRKDLLLDFVGARKASITDPWSGITRQSKPVQKHIQELATLVMGNNAYKWLYTAENEIRSLVAGAKQIIVVKSVIVPVVNIVSNLLHMISRGVPMAFTARTLPKKLIEVNTYTRNLARRIEAEAELRLVQGQAFKARKLEAEIQSIDDSNRRLTIWPLIEAGEFTTISDAGISRDELLLTQGKVMNYFTKLADKLPKTVREAGRQALITKDTALFQGLSKAVQYGDFLAKAVMYDDLLLRQKKTKSEALGIITEEFVNYDRLPGRTRGYLEDLGLLWFYNYKIRAMKVAVSVLRNNPVHALLSSFIPMPDMLSTVGTPLDDNLISKALSGKLPYSIGPTMGFHAPALHPIHQLIR